jgi:hypothetical protein
MTTEVQEAVHPLTLQLLEWINNKPRSYDEVLDAWRTSCPRLSIWEDACIAGLVACEQGGGHRVSVSAKGTALLRAQRYGPGNRE